MVSEVRRPSLKVTISWAGLWMVQRKDEAEHSTRAFSHSTPAKGTARVYYFTLLLPRGWMWHHQLSHVPATVTSSLWWSQNTPVLPLAAPVRMLCFNRRGSWDTILHLLEEL